MPSGPMNIVFRADASAEIGAGHVMRCLTLADALGARGGASLFVCRELKGHMGEAIRARGHGLRLLPPEMDMGADAVATRDIAAEGGRADWLVTDHYGIERHWEAAIAPAARRICVIGGPADRQHRCDVLHDQNYFPGHEAMWRPLVPPAALLLLGPRFALLRPEFRAAREARAQMGTRIFVSFGGGDAPNATALALRALATACPGVPIDAVIGPSNPHRAALEALRADMPELCLHVSPSRLADLMAGAGLAICGGGATLFEALCIGLPSLVVSIAENQSLAVKALAADGMCVFAGEMAALDEDRLARQIAALWHAEGERQAMAAKGMALVDGLGAARVADSMLGWREAA